MGCSKHCIVPDMLLVYALENYKEDEIVLGLIMPEKAL